MCAQPLTFVVRPMGDLAWLVRLTTTTQPDSTTIQADEKYRRLLLARQLARFLEATSDKPAALAEAEFVAGYDSVLVPFEAALAAGQVHSWLESQLRKFEQLLSENPTVLTSLNSVAALHHRIPVSYGGEYGPDLVEVARLNQLTVAEVINLHSSQVYEVYFVGFTPGFAYLGPLPTGLDAPRLARPRPKVKAGTVALAAGLTGVYPLNSPGGWQLIGYTATPIFTPQTEPPVLFRPGDKVSFYPI